MIEIIKETASYIVVLKPFGMESEHEVPAALAGLKNPAVHEKITIGPEKHSAGPDDNPGVSAPKEFFCIHRLDQAAGGLLVYAKTKKAAAELSAQLGDGRLQKEYLAVTTGIPSEPSGIYEDLLYRDRQKQKMFPVRRMRAGVKKASLEYTLLETYIPEGTDKTRSNRCENRKDDIVQGGSGCQPALSLVSVRLKTGRFHQIRVQFASRGMPLAGDGKYGSRISSKNLALFCHSLRFLDPVSGKEVSFRAPAPEEYPWTLFQSILCP